MLFKRIKKMYSSGGIIAYNDHDKWKFLLLKQKSLNGKFARWVAPKGGIEKNETKMDAAVREIYEESGLSNLIFVSELGDQSFNLVHKGEKSRKTVYWHLFIVKKSSRVFYNKKEGFIGYKWATITEALKYFSHPAFFPFLKKANTILDGISYKQ